MANINSVLSVFFSFRIPLKDWEKKASDILKEFFENDGQNVEPRRTSPPLTEEQKANRPKGKVLFPSSEKVDLCGFFSALCKNDFQTFSAVGEVKDDFVNLKFMLCPKDEVNWDDKRPFDEMQKACEWACSMAIWRAQGWDNQYIKQGRELNASERALSINATTPIWDGRVKHQITIKEDGEIVVS